ncbi:MAG TPA: VacJ family lipoprotein [Geminicoccus sp.]|uniref:MlaA family lipoprotein n=1 Tax=Geminicoccus sp. TaxID=2024832 RepID=UPI002E357220|nr:VacJ family lipoprotein [Geminicoccus sp.]HEX2526372.1 VacJ family lipoprotein [Geminicoccus sp.]
MASRPACAACLVTALLGGCSTGPAADPPVTTPPRRQIEQFVDAREQPATVVNPLAVYDPFEQTNRAIYKFNAKFDDYVYLPIVDAYVAVTPEPVRDSVSNFFDNLGEIPTFANSVLQGKVEKASPTLFRFMLNSTIGLFGLFDPASHIGLKRQDEDLGQTLGVWGVGDGPYLVLPILGPSNLRDATGTGVDFVALTVALEALPSDVRDDILYDIVVWGLWPIDQRYQVPLRYHSTGSPFEYDLVRSFVTKARRIQIQN